MSVSKFLADVARGYRAETMVGAMVFLRLERPLDQLVRLALANQAPHRGRASPWSHCFLLAEAYHGPDTKIFDCTLRNAQGQVEFAQPLNAALQRLLEAPGGIYEGVVGDYDDPCVTARGVKWLPGLDIGEQKALVDQALALKARGVGYDLPRFTRELVALILGSGGRANASSLFASAFAQKVYREALGALGDFASGVHDTDTTFADIWYSHKGIGIVDVHADEAVHDARTISLFADRGPALALEAQGPPALLSSAPPSGTRAEIERVLAKLSADPKLAATLPNYAQVRGTLENAVTQLNRIAAQGALGQSSALLHTDDIDLSLVLSAISTPKQPSELSPLFGRDIVGFHQYEDLDASWIASLWNRLTRSKVPFPTAKLVTDVVYPVPDELTIAIAGDWGTGNPSSSNIAKQIQALNPDYTIHLGDVYYSGTESEERTRFVDPWPAGKVGSLALNSNHEMYSGGHGYFGVALADKKFRTQHGYSYFALTNRTWLIIGLDSAHGSSGMYGDGVLNDQQLQWLSALVKSDVARSGSGLKNVLVLTHHEGIEMDGKRTGLFSQVTSALGEGPHRWYWGHVHSVAAFKPIDVVGAQLRARLVGHGGVPYAPDPLTPAISWTENALADDPQIKSRARNGFALLRFTADGLEETFYDELGNVRWRGP